MEPENAPTTCQSSLLDPTNQDSLTQFILPNQTYISKTKVEIDSPATEGTLMQIASTYPESCTAAQSADWTAECQAEKDALSPTPVPPAIHGTVPGAVSAKYTFQNPPGAPGYQLSYTINCPALDPAMPGGEYNECKQDPTPTYEKIPGMDPQNGAYYDESGKYAGPPDNFVASCVASKQAICQLEKAKERADEIIKEFPAECQLKPVK